MSWLGIVLPVLGEGKGLAGRLKALQPLRDRSVRIVVADGGSTDETWAVATAWADNIVHAPRGRGAQMNAGAQAGASEVLLFLHADTTLPADADHLIQQALSGGAAWGRFDVRIDGPHPMLRVVERAINLRSRLTGIATGDQAMFVRRDVFEHLGGFADIPLMEDIDLSARLKRVSRPACIRQPVSTSARRWEKHGVWRTIVLMWRLRAQYFLGTEPQALADRYGYARRPAPVQAALAILAKAPVAGLAKTRLIPLLGARGAARAQRRFAKATACLATQARLGPAVLWCAPDTSHRLFRALHRVTGIGLACQPQGDLGLRMRAAMEQHFGQHPELALLIIGTDCPVLAPGHLHQAAAALATHDAVLIPAEDGGYVLIGMRRPIPDVFRQVMWSTPQVLEQTRTRLRESGASWQELAPLWDVDVPGDWHRLQRLQPASIGPAASVTDPVADSVADPVADPVVQAELKQGPMHDQFPQA